MRLDALLGGPHAARLLAGKGEGRVLALFERSAYLAFDGGALCLGGRALGAGPLNLRTSASPGLDWRSLGLVLGSPVGRTSGGDLDIGGRISLSAALAETWMPPATPAADPADVRAALAALREIARVRLPAEGLGSRVAGPLEEGQPSLAGFAAGSLTAFAAWLDEGPSVPPAAAVELIGLGPGLTPSGDDLLGGAMIALRALDRSEAAERLFAAIRRVWTVRTHEIARAHLAAAAEGLGGESLHAILNDILAGRIEDLPECLEALDRVGHCSGWDGLAGIVMVVESWLRGGTRRRDAA